MTRPHLLVIDGASGSGKTTLARALAERLPGCAWVHPDGLWDTPRMAPLEIVRRAVDRAIALGPEAITIVDCQLLPSDLAAAARDWPGATQCVLLTCARSAREERLVARGWDGPAFDRVERWDALLRADAGTQGVRVFETDRIDVERLAELVAAEVPRPLSGDAV